MQPFLRYLSRLAVVYAICLTLAASDDAWREGKLITIGRNTGERYGQVEKAGPTVSTLHIDAGDRVYVVQCSAWFSWSSVPQINERSTVHYRIIDNHFYLKDDRGKQFKLQIVSTNLKNEPPTSP